MKQNVPCSIFKFICICALCYAGVSCDFENPFFEPLLFTVTFDAYDWEPGINTATCAPDERVALPNPNPVRDGYVFGGWYTEKAGGGARFTEKTPVDEDIRVYARWIHEKDAVTVTFDTDGGTPIPDPIVRARGETIASFESEPVKEKSVFSGWYTEKAGGGAQFTEKTPVNADITVYAKWIVPVRVTFNADGGTPAEAVVETTLGSTVSLPKNPTRGEHFFEGWYTEKEGGGAQFTEKTRVNADITVYAKWDSYPRVTFDADGGTPAQTSKAYAPGVPVLRLPLPPTRAGYIFDGWYLEKNGGGKKFTAKTSIDEDVTVYAKWKPYPQVTFDTDDGNPTTAVMCAADGTAALPSPDPARAGYVFGGWYTEQAGHGRKFTEKTVALRDITVYAKWIDKEDILTITFDADGGEPVPPPAVGIRGEKPEKLPSVNPAKKEHTFEGWYTGKNGTGARFSRSTIIEESMTVYAWWKPYPRVTFDANYGSPTTTVICEPNTPPVLPSPDPTRAGYVFGGWYTEKDGRGAQFTASSAVTADITVHAKWLQKLTVNGALELGTGSITFPNISGISLPKDSVLTIVLSGSNGAVWEVKVDAQLASITGSGNSRMWTIPPDMQNGRYTITVMIWIGSALYVGNFPIEITS
jgi:uncharacterized repeat protein (TIGR02543 family)